MKEVASVLFVHHESEPFGALEKALEGQSLKVCHASNCRDASGPLENSKPPHLVFTDTTLPDGTWADVLRLAAGAPAIVNVVIVARFVDIRLYVDVIERGAFDFLAPPFVPSHLAHMVPCGVENVTSRRHGAGARRVTGGGRLGTPDSTREIYESGKQDVGNRRQN